MQKSEDLESLRTRIDYLETQRSIEYLELKNEIEGALNSLKPTNLLKKTLKEVSASSEITDSLMSNSLGLATGYISKKLIVGKSINPIKHLLGIVLQFSVARAVAKHPQAIKAIGNYLINRIFRKRND